MLRGVAVLLIALVTALSAAGCARRPVAEIQQDLNKALAEQARVIESNMAPKEKLAKAKEIAKRIAALADEAKQHGSLSTDQIRKLGATREQALRAAEGLKRAVEKLDSAKP